MQTSDPRSCVWNATAIAAPETPPLQGEVAADVCVIGGGFTGLSAALHAAEAGARTVLLEAEAPGFGASGRNNGQVIPAYVRHNPDDIVALYGPEVGERMNAWVAGSADLVFDLIRRHRIECDAVQNGWLQPAHTLGRMRLVLNKYEQWMRRGAPVELIEDRDEVAAMTGSPIYHGAWLHRAGGHIQPLSFARGLARAAMTAGAAVHARSPAVEIRRDGERWRIVTLRGFVIADNVILATNAYTDGLWPGLRQSIVPVRSFHVATVPLSDNVARTILPGGQGLSDTRQALWAFRLDRSNRLVTTAAPLFTFGARDVLRRSTAARLRLAFPQIGEVAFECIWDGKVAMTVDRLPRYHALAPGLYAGLGYSGRGIALGTAMGKLMAERATGRFEGDPPIPVSPVEALPMHDLLVPLSRAMVLAYRWKDARG